MSKKEHWLYATRDGNSDTIEIYTGKPKQGEQDCGSCGGKETFWQTQRGTRYITDLCEEGFTAAGVKVPTNGIVKFKVVVAE